MQMEKVSANLEKLARFDTIRISKLLEIIQFTIVVFIAAFFAGSYIDRLFPIQQEDITDLQLWRDIILQLSLISVSAYYVLKFAKVVPFFFSIDSNYVSGSHGENTFGAGLAMAIIFVGVQKNFGTRIDMLKLRYIK